jgi:ankyrin repeat protein
MTIRIKSPGSVEKIAKEKMGAWKRKKDIADKRKALGQNGKHTDGTPAPAADLTWQEVQRLELEFKTAVLHGKIDKVKELLGMGVYTEPNSIHEWNALIAASANGHKGIVLLLLKHGSSVDAYDDFGNTALMYASRYGHLEIVETLIRNGAAIGARGEHERNALMFAAISGQTETIEFFIRTDAYLNSKDDEGKTALKLASEKGHEEIERLLRRSGAR